MAGPLRWFCPSRAPRSSSVVLRTIARVICALTNPHISEYWRPIFSAKWDASRFCAASVSSPGIPSAEYTSGVKCLILSRQGWRTSSGSCPWYVCAS
eukprot:14437593-Ditylum_brightwellii.AAC.1